MNKNKENTWNVVRGAWIARDGTASGSVASAIDVDHANAIVGAHNKIVRTLEDRVERLEHSLYELLEELEHMGEKETRADRNARRLLGLVPRRSMEYRL